MTQTAAYRKDEAAARILQACRQLMAKRLIARTWGNVSARLSQDTFLITPSGRAYETLTEADLVEVHIRGLRWEGEGKPSSAPISSSAEISQSLRSSVSVSAG